MKRNFMKLGRNFYVVTSLVFLVWMLLFDANDFISQYQMNKKLRDMEAEKTYYVEKIEEVKEDRRELMSNPQLLEKFAREKYLMKKNTEEVFVLVDSDNNPLE
jgi:cell division protein DivIC